MDTVKITKERHEQLLFFEHQYKASAAMLSTFIKIFNDRDELMMHLNAMDQERNDMTFFVEDLKKEENDLAKKLEEVSDILEKCNTA